MTRTVYDEETEKEVEAYTAKDCNEAGFFRYPNVCNNCDAINELTWCQTVNDAYCGECGHWQLMDRVRDYAKW